MRFGEGGGGDMGFGVEKKPCNCTMEEWFGVEIRYTDKIDRKKINEGRRKIKSWYFGHSVHAVCTTDDEERWNEPSNNPWYNVYLDVIFITWERMKICGECKPEEIPPDQRPRDNCSKKTQMCYDKDQGEDTTQGSRGRAIKRMDSAITNGQPEFLKAELRGFVKNFLECKGAIPGYTFPPCKEVREACNEKKKKKKN